MSFRHGTHPDFVELGNTLRNANNETNLIFNGFDDGVCGGGRGDVEDSRVRLGFPDGLRTVTNWTIRCRKNIHLLDTAKDREPKVGLSGLLRRDTTDHPSTVLERLLHMESTLKRKVRRKEQTRGCM